MQITVRNCLGVDRLEAAADPILLLSGPNGAGKSSTIRGLASALTGEIMPEGVAKKDSTLLVRDGADAARVVVTGPQGSAGVRWPEAERRTDGTPPKASPTAAGLTSLLDLPVKERARELDRLLKAAPSPADLAGALRDTDANFVTGGGAATEDEAAAMVPMALDPKDQRDAAIYRIVAGIWPTVEIDGFDGAHSRAADKGKELKGAWRQVTGEQYGSEKGAKWKAPGHELLEELEVPEADPVAHLTKQLAHVSSVAEGAARNFAIGQVDLDGTRAKAEQVPALQAAFDAAKKACDAANQAHNDVMAKRPGLIDVPMTCPHCSGAVQMEGGNLVAVSHAPSPEDITAARKRFLASEMKVVTSASSIAQPATISSVMPVIRVISSEIGSKGWRKALNTYSASRTSPAGVKPNRIMPSSITSSPAVSVPVVSTSTMMPVRRLVPLTTLKVGLGLRRRRMR